MIATAIFIKQSISLWSIFLLLSISSVVGIAVLFLNYSLWRNKWSKLMPGRKIRFLNPFGNFIEYPISRNGHSINAGTLQFLGGSTELLREHKLFCLWYFYMPFVVLAQAEAVEVLLSSTTITEKGWLYDWLRIFLGTGLSLSSGKKWKSRRRLLTPCLHFDILKDFMPVFNEKAQVLAKCLQEGIQKDFVDIDMPVGNCILDIICETVMGVKTEDNERDATQYIESGKRLEEFVMNKLVNFWQWWYLLDQFTPSYRQAVKETALVQNFTKSVIQEKKKKYLNEPTETSKRKRRVALLDLLLEHHLKHKDFTEDDIREEVDTFTAAGHSTTILSLCYAFYLIASHKDVQEKIHEELNCIFGDDTERHATVEDLTDMKYLDCVLKETKRLYPAVPVVARTTNEEMDICGYTIPKRSTCVISIFHLHRDPVVFPNPEKFDPDRFLPENSRDRHPFAYIPFSAGSRNCIGLRFATIQEKVIVSTILRKFTLEALDPRDKMVTAARVTLSSSIPFRLKIRPRT